MQRTIKNDLTSTENSSNETCYEFTSLKNIDLFTTKSKNLNVIAIQITVSDSIAMKQITFKNIYAQKHKAINLKIKNWALLQLHKGYRISLVIVLNFKLLQQYVESFEIVEKIDNLTYKLNISFHWNIWSEIFIAQLKFSSFSFRNHLSLSFISMKDKSVNDKIRLYEIKKVLITRNNFGRNIEYFVKWLDYDAENDFWRSLSELKNAIKLIRDFVLFISNKQHLQYRRRNAKNLKKFDIHSIDCYKNITFDFWHSSSAILFKLNRRKRRSSFFLEQLLHRSLQLSMIRLSVSTHRTYYIYHKISLTL